LARISRRTFVGAAAFAAPAAAAWSADAPKTVALAPFQGGAPGQAETARKELTNWLMAGPSLKIVTGKADYSLAGRLNPLDDGRVVLTITDPRNAIAEEATGEAEDLSYLLQQIANRICYKATGKFLPLPVPGKPAGDIQNKDAAQQIAEAAGGGKGPVKITLGLNRPNGSTYRFGEKVVISIQVDRECYLTLYNVDSQGIVNVVFPNEYNEDNKLQPGKTYTVPGEKEPWEIEVGGEPGMEILSAVATLGPTKLPDADGRKPRALGRFSKSLKVKLKDEGTAPETVSTASVRFFSVKLPRL
jgi:hypothetical protein